jgi:hypothetical protein
MPDTVDQPTARPTRKMEAVIYGGGAVASLVWLAGEFGVDMPDHVAAFVVVACVGVFGYFTKDRRQYTPTEE